MEGILINHDYLAMLGGSRMGRDMLDIIDLFVIFYRKKESH